MKITLKYIKIFKTKYKIPNFKIMKEEFTINKPHIANEFTKLLFSHAIENESSENTLNNKEVLYSIKESDLKKCLNQLGNQIQEREKSNFEQYTMFYENLLRQQHNLLYKKEREVVSIRNTLENKTAEVNIEVQCQMADLCYDLIMG
jgi:hypothetical protein